MGKGHARNEDTYLNKDGANEVGAGDVKDAVTKKHTSSSETMGGDISGTVGNASVKIDDFTIKKVSNTIKIADRIELNIMLNAFKIAINGSLTQFNMVDGISDEFEDESGIDTGASTNEDYDSSNDLYSPTSVAGLELDYMEYSTDELAQSNYVTSAGGEVVDQQQTYFADDHVYLGDNANLEYRSAQSFKLSATLTITAVEVYNRLVDGSPTGNWTIRIETEVGGLPSGILAHANASVVVAPGAGGNIVKGTFASSFELAGSTSFWIVMLCDNQALNDKWWVGYDSTGDPYGDGRQASSTDGGASWALRPIASDSYFKVYVQSSLSLQSYSEDTIKNQGSYSLKAIAVQTDSLNETLTLSGISKDLTDVNELKFWVYASRTGTNIQLQIHDSGDTTSTKDIVISSADTWTEITWDISGISNANKDDIDSIIIKVTNADSANTFYIDDFNAPGVTNNMVLISNSNTADAQPDNARIVIFEEDVDSITINTDLKAYISRDGGTTWTQVTLADEGDYETGKQILTGSVDISGQPAGTSMEYKIETLNNKDLKIHGVGELWD